MPKTFDDIIKEFDAKQIAGINSVIRQLYALFDKAANKIAFLAAKNKLLKNKLLSPASKEIIKTIARTVERDANSVIVNGIKQTWTFSDEKNTLIGTYVTSGSGGRKVPPGTKLTTAPGSSGRRPGVQYAVDAFVKRRQDGLNLSNRVHKLTESFKNNIENALQQGLETGSDARAISKKLISSLQNPEGKQNPGQGVYSSAKKNAQRLARSEINLAYATADQQRWKTEWFIIGYQVNLSNAHPAFDICDFLQGKYPKWFIFTKWHPNCLCNAVPILADQKTRDLMLDYQLGLSDKPPEVKYIDHIPKSATAWFEKNAKRVNGWKNKPYWLKANLDSIGDIFKL